MKNRSIGVLSIATAVVMIGIYFYYSNKDSDYLINTTASLPGYFYHKVKVDPDLNNLKKNQIIELCVKPDSKAYKIDKIIHKKSHGRCPTGRKPWLKLIAALPGDQVLSDGKNYLTINGNQLIGTKPNSKILPKFIYEGVVPENKILVYTNHKDSLDSRYFGFINPDEIVAVMEELF